MVIEMKKPRVKITKPLYLGISTLGISKILMYKFQYDYISPKYGDNAKFCDRDTDSFIIYIKMEDLFKKFLMMQRNGLVRLTMIKTIKDHFQQAKLKKVPGLFKDKLGGKIMIEFVALRPKSQSYLDDYGNKHKKSKDTKRCVIKQKLIHQNFKNCLFNNKTVYRSQERFKSYNHDMYTEEVNKIALSCSVDKIIQTFDKIETYPYGTNAFKLCESEMVTVKDLSFEMVLQKQ